MNLAFLKTVMQLESL